MIVKGREAVNIICPPPARAEPIKTDIAESFALPGFAPGRLLEIMRAVVARSGLDLSGMTILTEAATGVGQAAAQLNGAVNPNGEQVSDCHFEYGTSTSYGSSVPCSASPGAGEAAVAVSAGAAGLAPGVTYYARIVASSPAGSSYGAPQSFATVPAPSSVLLGALPGGGVLPFQAHQTPAPAYAQLAGFTLTVAGSGFVELRVSCPTGASPCTGVLGLRTLVDYWGSILPLASSPFTVAGGQMGMVKLHLSARARVLLARVHALRVHATLLERDATGVTHTLRTIVSLRQAKATRRG